MNKTQIDSALPGQTIKDDQVRGLQLRAFQGRKSFYVYYRANGQQRKPKIGDYPYVTLAQARQIAKEWIGKAVRGEDHSEQRQALRVSPTMRDLYDRYMVEHGRFKKSASADKARWEKIVIPFMGNAKVSQITRDHINAIHTKLQSSPYSANRTIAMLSKAFNLAGIWGWRTASNPCKGIRSYRESARKPFITADDYSKLIEAINHLSATIPEQCQAITLILATGARKSEIISAKNEWLIDGTLNLPDSKTGEKKIHLPSDITSIPTMSSTRLQKAWNKIRKEAGLPWLRIHDLRHNYAAVAISNGYSLAQIGELLGHRSTQTTKRYASLKDETAKAAAQDISDKILSRLNTSKPK